MKLKKYKGFSLAEVMIALLVVSLALAAAVPTITKRSVGGDGAWSFSERNENGNLALYTNSSNVIIGHSRMLNRTSGAYDNISGNIFAPIKDQLAIFKRTPAGGNNFAKSHIAFYEDSADNLVGRLALDENNIALGSGTLQSLTNGVRNTAIGQGALSSVKTGNNNTAVGFRALQKATGSNNTAIGSDALQNATGSNNIAVGYNAINQAADNASNNIAIGSNALNNANVQNNNIAIGANVGNECLYTDFLGEIIPFNAIKDNKFVIGQGQGEAANHTMPLIVGFLADGKYKNTVIEQDVPVYKGLTLYTDTFSIKNEQNNSNTRNIFTINNGTAAGMGRANIYSLCGNSKFCIGRFNLRSFKHLPKAADDTDELVFDEAEECKVDASSGETLCANSGNVTCNYVYDRDASGNVTGSKWYCTKDKTIKSVLGLKVDYTKISYKTGFVSFPQKYDFYLQGLGGDPEETTSTVGIGDPEYNKLIKTEGADKTKYVDDYISEGRILTLNEAVDYIEGFKETADWFYRARQTAKNNMLCIIFGYGCDTFNSNPNTNNWAENLNGFFTNISDKVENSVASFMDSYCSFNKISIICAIDNLTEDIKNSIQESKEEKKEEKIEKCADPSYLKWHRVSCAIASDARLKNILGDSKAGLKEINKLKVKNYTYKDDISNTPHVGVIAQDLKKVFPNSVFKGEDGYYRINQEEMFFAMVNAIKELSTFSDTLTASSVDAIDVPLSELEAQNKKLQEEYKQFRKQNVEFDKRLSALEKK